MRDIREEIGPHLLHAPHHLLIAGLHPHGIPYKAHRYHRKEEYDQASDQENILGTLPHLIILLYQ